MKMSIFAAIPCIIENEPYYSDVIIVRSYFSFKLLCIKKSRKVCLSFYFILLFFWDAMRITAVFWFCTFWSVIIAFVVLLNSQSCFNYTTFTWLLKGEMRNKLFFLHYKARKSSKNVMKLVNETRLRSKSHHTINRHAFPDTTCSY